MDNPLPKPKSGGKPERIEAKGPPGGPHTPGAKKAAAMRAKAAKVIVRGNEAKTVKPE